MTHLGLPGTLGLMLDSPEAQWRRCENCGHKGCPSYSPLLTGTWIQTFATLCRSCHGLQALLLCGPLSPGDRWVLKMSCNSTLSLSHSVCTCIYVYRYMRNIYIVFPLLSPQTTPKLESPSLPLTGSPKRDRMYLSGAIQFQVTPAFTGIGRAWDKAQSFWFISRMKLHQTNQGCLVITSL